MDKVIPILPCVDIRTQVAFYEALGFTCTGLYTAPNAYVTFEFGSIDLHFWGSKRHVPAENSSMVYVQVNDVDAVYEAFVGGLKQASGKVPRGGIPRISKVRDLKSDRRFTMTDPGGNTIYVGTPVTEAKSPPLRTLESANYAERFGVLYDLLYSKEDPDVAANLLPRLLEIKDELGDADKAKLLLVEAEIHRQRGESHEPGELEALLAQERDGEEWTPIKRQFAAMGEGE